MKSDDELRFEWLAENYAYVMVSGQRGEPMRQLTDPKSPGNLRAAIDHELARRTGISPTGGGPENA